MLEKIEEIQKDFEFLFDNESFILNRLKKLSSFSGNNEKKDHLSSEKNTYKRIDSIFSLNPSSYFSFFKFSSNQNVTQKTNKNKYLRLNFWNKMKFNQNVMKIHHSNQSSYKLQDINDLNAKTHKISSFDSKKIKIINENNDQNFLFNKTFDISSPNNFVENYDKKKKKINNFMNDESDLVIAQLNEQKKKLFSISLEKRSEYEKNFLPMIITKSINEIEKRGLLVEGIYRIPGGNSAILMIEKAFIDYSYDHFDEESQIKLDLALESDINAISSVLKRYLRKLSEPLITFNLYQNTIDLGSDVSLLFEKKVQKFRNVIEKLPILNLNCLHILCKHFSKINDNSNINRMNLRNLAVVFSPTIVRDEFGLKELVDLSSKNNAIEFIFTNYKKIFAPSL